LVVLSEVRGEKVFVEVDKDATKAVLVDELHTIIFWVLVDAFLVVG
jgi:hypothetical protein